MKNIIFAFFSLFFVSAYGQDALPNPTYTGATYAWGQYRGLYGADSGLVFTPGDTISRLEPVGTVRLKLSNYNFYVWTGSRWKEVSGSGGGGTTDSTVFSTNYRVDTFRTRVNTALNTKVNTSDYNALFDARLSLKTTDNVAEGTSKYYTDSRARAAISLTTSGTSGAATYNISTGVLNIPSYTSTATDTSSLSTRIDARVKYTDTASMLAAYLRKGDTASLSTRINAKLNTSDTPSMLSPYQRSATAMKYADTASLSNRINLKVSYSDTASTISTKKNLIDTAAALRAAIGSGGGGASPSNVAKKHVPLIIIAGESNARGYGDTSTLTSTERAVKYRSKIFNIDSGRYVNLRVGFNQVSSLPYNGSDYFPNLFGWEVPLTNALYADTTGWDTLYFCKLGIGSIQIDQLLDTTRLYNALRTLEGAYDSIMAKGYTPMPIILYTQGINDAGMDYTTWSTKTKKYIDYLRGVVGYAPVISPQLPRTEAYYNQAAAVNNLGDYLGWYYNLGNAGNLASPAQNDGVHWNASGVKAVGALMVKLFKENYWWNLGYENSQSKYLSGNKDNFGVPIPFYDKTFTNTSGWNVYATGSSTISSDGTKLTITLASTSDGCIFYYADGFTPGKRYRVTFTNVTTSGAPCSFGFGQIGQTYGTIHYLKAGTYTVDLQTQTDVDKYLTFKPTGLGTTTIERITIEQYKR